MVKKAKSKRRPGKAVKRSQPTAQSVELNGDKARRSERAAAKHPAPPVFPVVGVGASAGGLEAFTQLLKSLPPEPGMAFVFVPHLDPTHESAMTELLSRATRIPVLEVHDGIRLKPNHVYVIPPGSDMTMFDGV